MLAGNRKQINTIEVGDLVLFRVDSIDRGPVDPTNLLCYITKKIIRENNALFQLGSRAGCLVNNRSKESFYPWNCFTKFELNCDFEMSDIPVVALDKIERKVQSGPCELKSTTVRNVFLLMFLTQFLLNF